MCLLYDMKTNKRTGFNALLYVLRQRISITSANKYGNGRILMRDTETLPAGGVPAITTSRGNYTMLEWRIYIINDPIDCIFLFPSCRDFPGVLVKSISHACNMASL